MMLLTKERRKRIAKAARQLAYETAEGRGPVLNPESWCGCAIGESIKRAGIRFRGVDPNWAQSDLAFAVDELLPTRDPPSPWYDDLGLVSKATAEQVDLGVEGATVFPLLALADALEGK